MTMRSAKSTIGVRSVMALAGLAVVLGGCDRTDPNQAAVERASSAVVGLNGGGAGQATPEFQREVFTGVVRDVQGAMQQDAAPGTRAAAALLTAQSQLGLAEEPVRAALERDREARALMSRVSSLLADWSTRSATAAAAEGFDPAAQIASTRQMGERARAEIEQHEAKKRELEAKLAELTARVTDLNATVAAAQGVYAAEMERASKVSASEAAAIVAAANVVRREADALRMDAGKVQAEIDQLRPQIREAELLATAARNLAQGAANSIRQLEERQAQARREASEQRAAAAAAADELDKAVTELDRLVEGPMKQAFDEAGSALNRARGSAQEAMKGSPSVGRSTVAAVQQALGGLAWARAQSLGAYATMLENLARMTPALPKRENYASMARQVREQEKTILDEVGSAFEAAQNGFSGVPLRGDRASDAKTRLERVAELIGRAREAAAGRAADLQAAPAETPASGGDGAAASEIPVDPALRTTIESLIAASQEGRTADAIAMMDVPNEGLRQMIEASGRMEAAMRAKFGEEAVKTALAANPQARMLMASGGGMLDAVDVSQVAISMVSAEEASVRMPDSPEPLPFRKIDGTWKMVMDLGPQGAMMAPVFGPMSKAMDEVTKGVNDGTYPDANAAIAAAMQKIQEAVMGGMMPPPGGG
jgi:hypothetical protein